MRSLSKSYSLFLAVPLGLSACTTTPPEVNEEWIVQNCRMITGTYKPDSGPVRNCVEFSDGTYSCRSILGDHWRGHVASDAWHGLGVLRDARTGGEFVGELRYGDKWCGLELIGNEYVIYRNGDFERGRHSVDWQAVSAALMGFSDAVSNNAASTTEDHSWAWDQFQDQYGTLTWRCRGIQTGQFGEDEKCRYQYKADTRWPGW